MKKILFAFLILFVFANTAFAAWLGWKKDDTKGEGIVMVFKNENLGTNASSGEDLMKMVQYGDAILVDYGTKCYVLEKYIGKAKVRITSGPYDGYVGWVYIETLRE